MTVSELIQTMPKSVTYGPYTIKITIAPKGMYPKDNSDNPCWGITIWDEHRIKLAAPDTWVSPSKFLEIVVHELLHIMWAASGMTHQKSLKEEPLVRMTGVGILELFKRNPRFRRWYFEALEEL